MDQKLKQTEIGEIPEDWEVVEFGDNLDIFAGYGFKKSEYCTFGIKLLRIDNVSYGFISWDTIAYLPRDYLKKYPKLILKEGDILLALNRPITNDKLKIAILPDKDAPCILYQRVGKIEQKNDRTDRMYLFYILNKYIKKFVEESSVGSDQPFISTVRLKKYKIPFPSDPKEQEAIAEVLYDTDNFIQKLEKLIKKKKDIKKGVMQELLTGKTRLKGFSGGWEEKRMDEIFNFMKGSNLSKSKISEDGKKECILYGELFTTYSEVINKIKSKTNFEEGILSQRGDILMPGSTTTKGIDLAVASALMKDAIYLGGDINILRKKQSSLDSRFLSNYITHIIKYKIAEITQGTTIIHLYGKNLRGLSLKIPKDPKEQTAIANVLSDIDLEIENLERKRDKCKMIKEGMMQQLLTGKIRLKWKK